MEMTKNKTAARMSGRMKPPWDTKRCYGACFLSGRMDVSGQMAAQQQTAMQSRARQFAASQEVRADALANVEFSAM